MYLFLLREEHRLKRERERERERERKKERKREKIRKRKREKDTKREIKNIRKRKREKDTKRERERERKKERESLNDFLVEGQSKVCVRESGRWRKHFRSRPRYMCEKDMRERESLNVNIKNKSKV